MKVIEMEGRAPSRPSLNEQGFPLMGDATERVPPYVALTIGSFDGVHRGHRHVLNEVVQTARAARGTAAVLTMRPHPRQFFSPDHAPNLLTSDEKKLELLAAAGIDVVFLLAFTTEVAGLDRQDFVEEIVLRRCHAREMVIGHDFCFGKNALGDFQFLQDVGPRLGFTTRQVPPLVVEGERVSSTLVRERILQGDLEKAEVFLGRKYSIAGAVVAGRGIGATLGYPTANIQPHHSAIPAQGVYVAEAFARGGRYAAAVNIGIAPTIRHEDITLEAFLLDFSGNLLDSPIEVVFHRRIRPERKFPSHEALTAQIRKDVDAVREYFAGAVIARD